MDYSHHNFSPYSANNLNPPSEYSNLSDLLKTKENTISELKRIIQVYEKNTQNQNQKLSNHDSLLIEYNSLLKNYSELENELSLLKNENIQLKAIINKKNQTISEFQRVFDASKSKFELFEQTNNSLTKKIEELESKLRTYPNMVQNNNDLNMRLNEYESKLQLIKDEYNKKEELFKERLNNQEKLAKNTK